MASSLRLSSLRYNYFNKSDFCWTFGRVTVTVIGQYLMGAGHNATVYCSAAIECAHNILRKLLKEGVIQFN